MNISMLTGLTLSAVKYMRKGSDQVVFETTCGRQFHMYHSQACCEQVQLEDVCGDVEDLIGSPVTRAECRTNTGPSEYTSSTWTFYTISTIKGTVDLRWLGTSNGYYSEQVNFEELSYHDLARDGTLVDGVYEVETVDGREWWLWDQENWRDFSGEVLTTGEAFHRFSVLGPVLQRPA